MLYMHMYTHYIIHIHTFSSIHISLLSGLAKGASVLGNNTSIYIYIHIFIHSYM
jgi:hypothetical protein